MDPSVQSLAYAVGSDSTDQDLLVLARRFRDEPDDPEAVACLARRLAESGRIEIFSSHAADVASTGGPSSLTTLLCPLFLVRAGWDVPKLTVPGRPAGGIDVLMTIPKYRARASSDDVRTWLNQCKYAHILATDEWAPLDGRLFELRRTHGYQNVRPLVVASILSKKLALGLSRAAVEIRRGHFGNLGEDEQDLQRAVDLFESVGELLGIPCRAIITGSGQPYQPYIGRGEALLALHSIFTDRATAPLEKHLTLCRRLAEQVTGRPIVGCGAESLREAFEANLTAQGASYSAFLTRVAKVSNCPTIVVHAPATGRLQWDLGALRAAVVAHQGRSLNGISGDACGVVLDIMSDDVKEGTAIARVRGTEDAARAVSGAIIIKGSHHR